MAKIGALRAARVGVAFLAVSITPMPFELWKQRLRDDCARCDRLWGFDALGEECLRVLWQAGTDPSVDGLIDDCRNRSGSAS